jgi:hypothetical protein
MARARKRTATPAGAIDGLSEQASQFYEDASESIESTVEAITEQVGTHPFASLLLAFGFGFLTEQVCCRKRRRSD